MDESGVHSFIETIKNQVSFLDVLGQMFGLVIVEINWILTLNILLQVKEQGLLKIQALAVVRELKKGDRNEKSIW